MDLLLLEWANQSLAHPLLDILMVGLTTVGFAALPLLGIILILRGANGNGEEKRVGSTILYALGLSTLLTFIFYYLILRPRPEDALILSSDIRLILPTPFFPSYPSGHSAAAFATAIVLYLAYRQQWTTFLHHGLWSVVTVSYAILIAFSRLYLGHHYPSDLFGGMVIGLASGATCYGLMDRQQSWQKRIRWLLWLQIALVVIVTQIAYLDILPLHLLRWPYADKVLHGLLFGAITFWLTLWLPEQTLKVGRVALPIAIVLPFAIALMEEWYQAYSPIRTADLGDLVSDLVGMVLFWRLGKKVCESGDR